MCFQDQLRSGTFPTKNRDWLYQLRVWWWGKRKHKSASESDPCGPSSSGGFGAEEPSFTICFIFPLDALYHSPFDVNMTTSDATVTAPKLGYKMRVFPALVWDLNTLFIPWQNISHTVPRESRLCLGQLLTYNPRTGSISLPTVGAVQQLEKDLMLALYLSPTSGHSPSWARTCLTCAGCPWRSLVRVLLIFVCALMCTCGHTCQS